MAPINHDREDLARCEVASSEHERSEETTEQGYDDSKELQRVHRLSKKLISLASQ